MNDTILNYLVASILITSSLYIIWNYSYYLDCLMNPNDLNPETGIQPLLDKLSLWYTKQGTGNFIPDAELVKILDSILRAQDISIPVHKISFILTNFHTNHIAFDLDLFYLIICQIKSHNGIIIFDNMIKTQGFKFYLSWVTQIFPTHYELPEWLEQKLVTCDFSNHFYFKHGINYLFTSVSGELADKMIEQTFSFNYEALDEAFSHGIPKLDVTDLCYSNPYHICNHCTIKTSFGTNEHWVFDILTNKFDHLYTIIWTKDGYVFKYDSYSDMFKKRFVLIDNIRSLDNNTQREKALFDELIGSLNNSLDLWYGYSIENLAMIKESNYFDLIVDVNHWSKIFRFNSNVVSDLAQVKLLRSDTDTLKFLKFNEIKTVDDWINFTEFQRLSIHKFHLCYLWDSFTYSNSNILLNDIKKFLVDNDPEKLRIWDLLIQETDKEIRVNYWAYLLNDRLIEYLFKNIEGEWIIIRNPNIEFYSYYPQTNRIIPNGIMSKNQNSSESNSESDSYIPKNSDSSGPGSENPPPSDLDSPQSSSSGPDPLNIISTDVLNESLLNSILHSGLYLGANLVLILYSCFVWFIIFLNTWYWWHSCYKYYFYYYYCKFCFYLKNQKFPLDE